ncbi:MAG: ABC transporter permease [Caldilineaceae bacterium]
MSKRMQRLVALSRKEVTQLLRDRRGLVFIFGLPLIQLFLYAYAVNTTVYHTPLAVVDQSRDRKSREFIQALVVSQYFDLSLEAQNETEVIAAIDSGRVRAGLLIPPHFAATTDRGVATALLLLDGSDSASVASGYSAAALIGQNYGLQLAAEQLQRKGIRSASASGVTTLPITTSTRVLYNPDMIDIWFLLPGLAGLILQTLAIQQAALIVVRERELGTIEPILATPTRPLELVLSKMIPLLILCFLALGVVVLLGVFWFGVPFQGNLWLYFGLSLLFITSSLGLGLLISNRATTQRQAQQQALMTMMFSLLLGGMIYPRTSMPAIPRFIGSLLPMTYFVRISRGIFTKGIGIQFLWSDGLALVLYSLIVILIAARNFKRRLD